MFVLILPGHSPEGTRRDLGLEAAQEVASRDLGSTANPSVPPTPLGRMGMSDGETEAQKLVAQRGHPPMRNLGRKGREGLEVLGG